MIQTDEGTLRTSEAWLSWAEASNRALGHENRGAISRERGFLPLVDPLLSLPAGYACWDETAARLPELHTSLRLRAHIERWPTLDASEASLPDQHLLRASHLLAMFAHAYCHVESMPPAGLPSALSVPWQQVRDRLGRVAPVLTYVELVAYNWRFVDPAAARPLRVENLRLLTPTLDNAEERRFHLTQVEILAECSPLVAASARAQRAMRADDTPSLMTELELVRRCLARIAGRSLAKINPMKSSKRHVDPIVWAKTVAPFTLPMLPGQPGPSAAASPIFSLLDGLLGRKPCGSFLGELHSERSSCPPFWREFLNAVEREPVPPYVAKTQNRELAELFDATLEAYAGEEGFLGRQRRKVYGYLEIACKVSGFASPDFQGAFESRARAQGEAERPPSRRERPGRTCPVSELIVHNDAQSGYWFAIDGVVYDVTRFVEQHPGGAHTLQAYAGTDATHAFRRAHAGQALPLTLRARYAIAHLARPALPTQARDPEQLPLATLYSRLAGFGFLLCEMQAALLKEQSLQSAPISPTEPATRRSPYKLERAIDAQMRFFSDSVGVIAGPELEKLLPSLPCAVQELRQSDAFRFVEALPAELFAELRQHLDCDSDPALSNLCRTLLSLEARARQLLTSIKAELHRALEALEARGTSKAAEATEARSPSSVTAAWETSLQAIPGLIALYCDSVVSLAQTRTPSASDERTWPSAPTRWR